MFILHRIYFLHFYIYLYIFVHFLHFTFICFYLHVFIYIFMLFLYVFTFYIHTFKIYIIFILYFLIFHFTNVLQATTLAHYKQLAIMLPYFLFFIFFRAAPSAYVSSQARGSVRAAATGLHHSHSNARFEPHLRPTTQLTPTPDLSPDLSPEWGQGSILHPHGY